MIMIMDSVKELKRFSGLTSLKDPAHSMVLRMMLAFMLHRGRMSCSRAGGVIRTEPVHRGQITRFLARPRWQKDDFNAPPAGGVAEFGDGPRQISIHYRCGTLRPIGEENTEHLQHGQPKTTTTQAGTTLRQEPARPKELPQFYVRFVDHAAGVSAAVSDPALHEGVLPAERDRSSHGRRVGRRVDSQLAAARGSRSDRAGRHR